ASTARSRSRSSAAGARPPARRCTCRGHTGGGAWGAPPPGFMNRAGRASMAEGAPPPPPPHLHATLGRRPPPGHRPRVAPGGRAAAAGQAALGLPVPAVACRAGRSGERAALWLGPDEWLLLAPPEQAGLAARLARALGDLPHSLVEVSHRQLGLLVHGEHAAT